MPNVYADRHLKTLVQRRAEALSEPEGGKIVTEKEALLDMLADQYHSEYRRMKGDQGR